MRSVRKKHRPQLNGVYSAVHVCGSQQNHRICSQTATFPAIYFAVNSQRTGLACLNKDVTGERTGKRKWFPRQHCKYNCLQRMQEEQRTCFSTFCWQCSRSQGSARSQVGNEQRQKHSRHRSTLKLLEDAPKPGLDEGKKLQRSSSLAESSWLKSLPGFDWGKGEKEQNLWRHQHVWWGGQWSSRPAAVARMQNNAAGRSTLHTCFLLRLQTYR